MLGASPTKAQRKGEAIPVKAGERIAIGGSWHLEAAAAEPENLDAQVSELLGKLTENLQVWRSLGARYRVDLFCGWFMNEGDEGVCISPITLRALGERSIELGICVYAPSSDA